MSVGVAVVGVSVGGASHQLYEPPEQDDWALSLHSNFPLFSLMHPCQPSVALYDVSQKSQRSEMHDGSGSGAPVQPLPPLNG